MKAISPVLDLSTLPVVLTLAEVAGIYRLSIATIRRGLQANTFRPLPFAKYPYRWKRDEVLEHLDERDVKLKKRRHGFAATKLKREREDSHPTK